MKIFIIYSFLWFSLLNLGFYSIGFNINFCYGQKEKPLVKGLIANYANQYMNLYKCFGDTLLFVDSVKTDAQGKFTFSNSKSLLPKARPNSKFKVKKVREGESEQSSVGSSQSTIIGSRFASSTSNFKLQTSNSIPGLYRFSLPQNQWFYILNDGKLVKPVANITHANHTYIHSFINPVPQMEPGYISKWNKHNQTKSDNEYPFK